MPVLGNTFASKSKLNYLSVLSTSSPYIHLYPWVRGSGIGTKFSNPSTAITGAISSTAFNASFSSGSRYILAMTNTSPYLQIYAVTNSGFGTKVSNPATTPPETRSAYFSPSNTDVIVFASGFQSAAIHSYSWTGSAFGSKSANVSAGAGFGPTGSQRTGNVSKSGKAVGQGFNGNGASTSHFITAFTEGVGVGTRYTDPADSRSNAINTHGFTWNPQGNVLVVSGVSANNRAINWSDDSGYGTSINILGGGEAYRGSFNQTGNFFLAVNSNANASTTSFPLFTITAFSSAGFGTIIARPFFTIPSTTVQGSNGEFSPYGTEFVVSLNLNNSIYAYPFTGSSIGTKYSDPATLPAGTVVDTRFG
jgi:hypothetical protein